MQKSEVRMHAFGKACHLVVDNLTGRGPELLERCGEEIRRLEQKFGTFHPESLVSRINQDAGTGVFTPLDAESHSLLKFVEALWTKSMHVFDPTTRILRECYNPEGSLRASQEQLKGMLQLVGWGQLELTDQGAHLARKGMVMDLNSCVRPYLVDSLKKILEQEGARHALVELEQDIATIGKQPDGANWLVGLRYPKGNSAGIQRIKLNDASFALRGDFERTMQLNGERYSQSLSPVDGQPIPGVLAVAVNADSCLASCSAAGLAMMKAEPAALNWLESLGLPWLAIDRNLQCHGPLAAGMHRA
ncbi:MAG: FAD:protein FMN transferase [Halioglobus sp.]|nr:FAD:protein FMN transferase [Halioglobus sp.]